LVRPCGVTLAMVTVFSSVSSFGVVVVAGQRRRGPALIG
jgi:hypothetical protein